MLQCTVQSKVYKVSALYTHTTWLLYCIRGYMKWRLIFLLKWLIWARVSLLDNVVIITTTIISLHIFVCKQLNCPVAVVVVASRYHIQHWPVPKYGVTSENSQMTEPKTSGRWIRTFYTRSRILNCLCKCNNKVSGTLRIRGGEQHMWHNKTGSLRLGTVFTGLYVAEGRLEYTQLPNSLQNCYLQLNN